MPHRPPYSLDDLIWDVGVSIVLVTTAASITGMFGGPATAVMAGGSLGCLLQTLIREALAHP